MPHQTRMKPAEERGRRAEMEDEERGRGRSRRDCRKRRAASEGGEQSEKLRLKVHQLEKEKLELTSSHNQDLCRLQSELTCLRSSVERGEAQRVELQYQLTVSRREADRVSKLSRDHHILTERAAELQHSVQELQKALDITRRSRDEDQQTLQQEVEERDRLIQSFTLENQHLRRLLQDHREALEESERRIAEVHREREKENEVNRRQAEELKYLMEREKRFRREKEVSDQKVKSLESSIEEMRASHLETKVNTEVIQLRARDLESALLVERSGQQEVQSSLDLLRAQFREVERAYSLEKERSSSTEHALERLQWAFEQCKSDLSIVLETEKTMTSDLRERLEEEKRRHDDTHALLQQAAQKQCDAEEGFLSCVEHIRETLHQHNATGTGPQAKDDGSAAEALQLLKATLNSCQRRQEVADKQVEDLLLATQTLQEENQTLRQLTSDQSRQVEESQQASCRLEQEVDRLCQSSSDCLRQRHDLQAELEMEREQRTAEVQKITEHYEKELKESQQVSCRLEQEVGCLRQESFDILNQRQDLKAELEAEREERTAEVQRITERYEKELKESQQVSCRLEQEVGCLHQESFDRLRQRQDLQAQLEAERDERTAEVQKITEHYEKESKTHQSFLYCIYQRLLAGCVLLDQPQSILGNFTWAELCDVINEHVDQLTSDLRQANEKVAQLQSVCERKSACVRQLQRSQECVLSRLEESVWRREEAWSHQHTHTVTQLQNEQQILRAQCESLRDQASSLQLHNSSLISDLSQLKGVVSRSRRESTSFLSACALLAGALRDSHRRLQSLCTQKSLLSRWLAEKEGLEEEVRRLATALGGEEEEEEMGGEERKRKAVRWWRRSVCVVLAVRRWRELGQQVSFRLEVGGGGSSVCVCGGSPTATQQGQDLLSTVKDKGKDGEGRQGVCAHWLRSKCLASIILSSMTGLQRTLADTGSSYSDIISASQSALSCLLSHFLNQSEGTSSPSHSRFDNDALRRGLDSKVLVSTLQQHFLLFSQRLHSAEVERLSLRLEVADLKRGLQQEAYRTVPAERFHSACEELHQALSREHETQKLIQDQSRELQSLQFRVKTHATEQSDIQHTLCQTKQSLSEALLEVKRKERSLRILGEHLLGIQKERKQWEERLQRAEDELKHTTRCKDHMINTMKAAEMSYQQVTDSLIQSRQSMSDHPHPLPLPKEQLEVGGAQSIMGTPEMAAYQSLLSTFSRLYHTCFSRMDWQEQQVSTLRSHVTALLSELQDICPRDNLAFIPVLEDPEPFPSTNVETPQLNSPPDLTKEPPLHLSPVPSQSTPSPVEVNPAPSSPLSKPSTAKTKEKKAPKKNKGSKR